MNTREKTRIAFVRYRSEKAKITMIGRRQTPIILLIRKTINM
jgi:hypothetical protein